MNYSTHNVVETEPAIGGGQYLRRFPRAVRQALSPLGCMVAEESAGVEIRFVTESDGFRLSLGAEPSCLNPFETHGLEVFIFRGDYFYSRRTLEAGPVNHIAVNDVGGDFRRRLAQLGDRTREGCRFSPEVWRVLLGRFPASFLELSTHGRPCRPPLPEEVPTRRWLAYGSSITNGASPSAHHLAYIYQAAHHLGVDVFNQGLSGSCRCEPEVAAYLAARCDYDLITLEIGVNMRADFTPAEFEQRATHLVRTIASAHPGLPVALISLYPNADLAPFTGTPDSQNAQRQTAFNQALQRIASNHDVPLLDGASILREFRHLSSDLIHPSDYGHIEMGRNLAEQLRRFLPAA